MRQDMMTAFWKAIQRPGGAVGRGPRRWYVETHPEESTVRKDTKPELPCKEDSAIAARGRGIWPRSLPSATVGSVPDAAAPCASTRPWRTLASVTEKQDSRAPAIRLLQDLEGLLKDPHLALDFGRRGVNTSLVLLAVQGLIAYFDGDKVRAADDLGTVAEEIRARLESR
jgi:hypothetical protein